MIRRAEQNDPAIKNWQALVIGGGLGGVVAARRLAEAGLRTLLVEAKRFPRDKVCGGCLNQRAVAGLRAAGFGEALDAAGGLATAGIELHQRGRTLYVPTPPGLAVTRRELDMRLIDSLGAAGVETRQGVRATVMDATAGGGRRVQLVTDSGATSEVEAAVVIVADGLGAPSLARLPEIESQVETSSLIGIGGVLEGVPTSALAPGRIHMAIGGEGYVGLVRCERGRLNLAGAFDPSAIEGRGAIAGVVQRTLAEAGLSIRAPLQDVPWRGTRHLTQTASRFAASRLFLLGDAAGYVEPFTGEGMAAAIEDALAVIPLAIRASEQWTDSLADAWQAEQTARRRRRQADCRRIAWLLRRPWATRIGLQLAAAWPTLGKAVAQRVSAPRHRNQRGVA
ncbi:NAD(P)/FAD-dependent oxidoreductase [Botrimarina colliarenosi]|uniref:NAD(P)/FAD-dependent oxidoreductase n=1 Tax=Botrimarina colliarenosi TaxID=2528001 RepID=UPI0018D33724|nr:FAD-dependent monooxygenase [Botrimarina colliarenosi]